MKSKNKPIPYYKREQIAREFHFTAKSQGEIAKKYRIHRNTPVIIGKEFPPEYFKDEPNRIHRSLWILNRKLQEVANNGDLETLNKVATILSRV